MEEIKSHNVNYTRIWILLGLLMAVSVTLSLMGFLPKAAVILIFAIALWKATLVARNYMHLRWEGVMIYLILAAPLLLFLVFLMLLMPDFGTHYILR